MNNPVGKTIVQYLDDAAAWPGVEPANDLAATMPLAFAHLTAGSQ
jgi:hypothetical protein